MKDIFLSAKEVNELKKNKQNIIIFDSSYFLPNTGINAIDEYNNEHIEDSVFFDIDKISDPNNDLPHMFPTKDIFETHMQKLGLNNDHIVISNASCTTNCLSPVAYVVDKEFGIENGYMTTIHSYTGDQSTVDTFHKDLRRARAAASNIIPTSTGAAKAVGLVLPHLKGKLDGTAIRVPTPNVSLVDFKFNTKKPISVDTLNAKFKEYANGPLKGILGVDTDPKVSSDYNHDSRSSILDLTETTTVSDTFGRILTWYDNEWGFSNRMLETSQQVCKL